MNAVPVDDTSLRLLREAIGGTWDVNEAGEHTLVGAEFSLPQLLKFWSGYDPAKERVLETHTEYDEPVFHYTDVIVALIDEIDRLRQTAIPDENGSPA